MFLNVAKRNVASTFVKKISRLDVGRSDDDEAPYKAMHGGQGVYIHPSSVLFSLPGGEKKLPQYVAFNELLVTSKQYMRCITAVEESWLMEVAPKFYKRPSI
jgi:HrpA-like RNA helicase